MYLLIAISSSLVKGLLLITKSTPFGSLMWPMLFSLCFVWSSSTCRWQNQGVFLNLFSLVKDTRLRISKCWSNAQIWALWFMLPDKFSVVHARLAHCLAAQTRHTSKGKPKPSLCRHTVTRQTLHDWRHLYFRLSNYIYTSWEKREINWQKKPLVTGAWLFLGL